MSNIKTVKLNLGKIMQAVGSFSRTMCLRWALDPKSTSHYDLFELELLWAWQPTDSSNAEGLSFLKETRFFFFNGNPSWCKQGGGY